jgi:hypothetical protein
MPTCPAAGLQCVCCMLMPRGVPEIHEFLKAYHPHHLGFHCHCIGPLLLLHGFCRLLGAWCTPAASTWDPLCYQATWQSLPPMTACSETHSLKQCLLQTRTMYTTRTSPARSNSLAARTQTTHQASALAQDVTSCYPPCRFLLLIPAVPLLQASLHTHRLLKTAACQVQSLYP